MERKADAGGEKYGSRRGYRDVARRTYHIGLGRSVGRFNPLITTTRLLGIGLFPTVSYKNKVTEDESSAFRTHCASFYRTHIARQVPYFGRVRK